MNDDKSNALLFNVRRLRSKVSGRMNTLKRNTVDRLDRCNFDGKQMCLFFEGGQSAILIGGREEEIRSRIDRA